MAWCGLNLKRQRDKRHGKHKDLHRPHKGFIFYSASDKVLLEGFGWGNIEFCIWRINQDLYRVPVTGEDRNGETITIVKAQIQW